MKCKGYDFTIIRADKIELDVRKQMSEIFAEGFAQWLEYFSKDKNIIAKTFAHMFVLDQFYVAVVDNKIAAMAACTDCRALAVRLDKKELRKHLGIIKGSIAGIVLKKEFESPFKNPAPETGSIEYVGTALEFRGQGAASQIIRYIIENTSYKKYLIEAVADTNLPALKLYKKLGFRNIKGNLFPQIVQRKLGLIILFL